MEPKSSEYRSWDDLVFEKRNKSYGAYVLRKSYSDNVLTGMFGSLAFVMLLFFISSIKTEKKILPPVINDTFVHVFDQPPNLKREQPVKRTELPKKVKVNKSLPPRVVSEPVANEPVTPEEPVVSSTGSDTGTATPIDGATTGVGVVDVPVVPFVEEVRSVAQVMPSYQGGLEAMMKFIKKNLKYPNGAQRIGIEGTVYVQFIVNGNGTVTNVQVLRGFHPDCDKEAVRVIAKLPGWNGGKQGGQPVGVRMVLPITFKIS
jgi:periplasmic protein TonB